MRKPLLLLTWAVAAFLFLQTVAGNIEFDDDITFEDVPTRPEGPGRPEESSLGSRIVNTLSRIKRGLWDFWNSADTTSPATSSENTPTTDSSSSPLTTESPSSVESTYYDATTHSRETRSTTSSSGSQSTRVGDDEDLNPASGSGSEVDVTRVLSQGRSDSYVIFRIRVYIHEFWNPSFAQKNSPEFERFAKNFTHELEKFFDGPVGDDPPLPGSRRATVIGIEPSDDTMLVRVTADLGSKGYDEADRIKHRLKRHLESTSRLGDLPVKIDKAHPLTIQRFTEPNTNGFSPCEVTQLACTDGTTCLPLENRCNGESNCPDGSDEEGCPTTTEPIEEGDSRSPESPQSVPEDLTPARCDDRKLCPNKKKWICASMVCDGNQDCPEISEEEGCPEEGTSPVLPETTPMPPSTTTTSTYCYTDEFMCDLTRCLQSSQRCDGRVDCTDGTDEEGCPKNPCLNSQFTCDDGECVELSQKCNRIPDCADGSDEKDCDKACNPPDFRCSNGSCISGNLKCNGRPDCPNGEDEREPDCPSRPLPCLDSEFTCNSGQCVHKQYLCDNINDCLDKSDEDEARCSGDACMDDDFYCQDTNKCIRSGLRCDGTRHCDDGSDELDCPGTCAYTEYECSSGQCIEASQRCNGQADCDDGSDEDGCYRPGQCNTYSEFTCDDGQCVSKASKCNGVEDCSDGSDESNCITNEIQLVTSPTSQEIEETKEAVFQCRDEGPSRYKVRWLRGDGQPLPEGSRTLNHGARLEIPNVQLSASGAYICEAIGAPRSAAGSRTTVYLRVTPFIRIPDTKFPEIACQYNEATCYNRQCIPKENVCDGKIDCTDGSDESRCSEHACEANHFMCANRECILKTWQCDNQKDCLDGSDEVGCNVSKNGTCYSTEFACRSGNQCIPRGMVCDKQRDCTDNSDEIGCKDPEIVVPPRAIVSLCEGDELTLTCQSSGFPIPFVNWRLNWGHVPQRCRMLNEDGLGTLICSDMRSEESGAYSCEAINGRSKFAIPDANVIVKSCNGTACEPGTFNELARSPDDCIKCFCFGRSTVCKSANLYSFKLPAPTHPFRLVSVRLDQDVDIYSGYSAVQNYLTPSYNGFEIRSPIGGNGTQYTYYAMPEETHKNQLKSYGGYITYKVTPGGDTRSPYLDIPDIIIKGNDRVLTYRRRDPLARDRENEVIVRLFEGEWQITSLPENRQDEYATREDIMMVLHNIENILIRAQYIEGPGIDTAITDINMDSAHFTNTGRAKAAFVEECSCPRGYEGLSCEECAPGFQRQPGSFLGVCSEIPPVPIDCRPGYYGAPERGIPCRRCPCPLTNYPGALSTCRLGPGNEAICDCREGYVGERCQSCDVQRGYSGDARLGTCAIRTAPECSPDGSVYPEPIDGACECKPFATGTRCDRCVQNAFHLSINNTYGCIKCFCMGTTKECTSSNLYRDNIETTFYGSSLQGFSLVKKTRDDLFEKITPLVDPSTRELYFDNFDTEVYYWALPPAYLFDKVTSYGGNLEYTIRYTPSPGGLSSKNNAADVEIRSANRITLSHFAKQNIEPEQTVRVTVPLLEQHWQSEFGRLTDREHLLQALADVSGIYIKATYTTSTSRASLISVSLDTATDRNTGRPKAVEVEQCNCLPGYIGTSCEDCAPGYKRTEDGIYLGICEPCECGGYSEDCDPDSGECRNCRDNRVGPKCESCAPGSSITPEGDCQPQEPDACRSCDSRGTMSCRGDRCVCKVNVEGARCDRCRPGTFHLSSTDEAGCSDCYCSEVTTECMSSSLYMQPVPAFILDDNHGFTLSDGASTVIRDGFRPNYGESELGYRMGWQQERMFWSLPSKLTGDKVLSYGGTLAFAQRYSSNAPDPQPTSDHDIIISGNSKSIFYTFDEPLQPEERKEQSVVIAAGKWRILDQRSGNPIATRQDILKVLSNVDHILIRASLAQNIEETFISDVFLETATQNSDGPRAEQVEVCRCPPEYRGTSCQSCAEGHYRNYDNTCKRCPCVHGKTCLLGSDYEVKCNCDPGWQGKRCEEPVEQTPDIPPAQPLIRIEVTISPEGVIKENSRVTLQCAAQAQYREPLSIHWSKQDGRLPPRVIDDGRGRLTIMRAHSADSGVYLCTVRSSNATETRSVILTVDAEQTDERPQIRIFPSTTIEALEGSEISVQCAARGYPIPDIEWLRLNGKRFNEEAEIEGGNFRIRSALKSDEGEYECRASNRAGYHFEVVTIRVRATQAEGKLSIEPRDISILTGQTITIRCSLEPPSDSITLDWSRNDRREFSSRAESYNGELTIRDVTLADSGVYVCTATDSDGYKVSEASAYVRVRYDRPSAFSVSVTPSRMTVDERDTAVFTCNSSLPGAEITWSVLQRKETRGRNELPRKAQTYSNVLRIPNVEWSDRAVYVCQGNLGGSIVRAQAFLEVRRRGIAPVIELSARQVTLLEGGSDLVDCRPSGGSPVPQVSWSKRNSLLPRNIVQEGNLLRFNGVQLGDTGEYVCTAENSAGKTSATLRLDVQKRPKIRTDPSGTVRKTIGDRLTLNCLASGVPVPVVRWEINTPAAVRSNVEGTTGTGSAQYEVYRLSEEDSGSYVCKATSPAGEREETVYVQVLDNEVDPSGPSRRTFSVDLGGATEITCSHPSDTEVEYSWTRRDGRPLGRGVVSYGERLVISNAEMSDAGEYVCEIQDRNGYSQTSSIATLNVIERLNIVLVPPSQIVQPNENPEILCRVIGDKPADITWEGVDRQLPATAVTSGGRIRFNNIQPDDQGRYMCIAVDPVTRYSVKALARVTVKAYLDRGDRPPTVTIIGDKNITKTEGASLQLQCVVTDTPNVRIDWRRQGNSLPRNADTSERDLVIPNLYPEDSGIYICTATTSSGLQGQDQVTVNVQQGCSAQGKTACSDGITCYSSSQMCDGYDDCPDGSDENMCRQKRNHGALVARVLIEPSVDRIRVGETVDLRCIVEGVFASDEPMWEKVGGRVADNVITRGNILRIQDVTSDNAGRYRCWVKKQNGQIVEDEYLLEVQDDPSRDAETERPHTHVKRLAEKTKAVQVFDSVDIECDTGLEPPVTFIWTKRNGQLLANQTGSKIHLTNVLLSDAGEYLCVASNSEVKIEFPTFLVVKGTIPRFTQQSPSFLKLKPIGNAGYLKLDMLLSIKPERPTGLILYNGNHASNQHDFIAIGLKNGRVEFRFDVGSGEAIILSNVTVPMGKWSNITIKRHRKEGKLWVNGIGPFIGTSNGRYQGLDLSEPIYLGTVPDFTAINPAAGFDSGFVGCVSFLKINDRVEELSKPLEKTDVTDCDTCSKSQCKNNGVCQEAPNERGYQCLCPRGFSGEECQFVGSSSACYPGLCGEGKCINTHGSYKCQCKLGTAGQNCEQNVKVKTPQFNGNSFLAYPIPLTTSDFSLTLDVLLDDTRNSLLAYAGQHQNGIGDFIALTVRDQQIEFTVDTGSGSETIRNPYVLQTGKWVNIKAKKRADELSLNVNGDFSDKVLDARKTKVHKKGFNLHTPLYLGGHDDSTISLHPSIFIKEGFRGCIRSLSLNGRPPTNLIKNAIESSNVRQCHKEDTNSALQDDLCGEQRCQNGGSCDLSDGTPVCQCSSNYGGSYCEIRTNECGQEPNPCGSNGVCQTEKSVPEGYKCDCFFGFTGPTCQERVSITTDASFRRESYIELPGHLTSTWRSDDEVSISMTIQTEELIGLLFWQGTDGHYMSIGVKDGFVEAEVDHNDNPLTLRARERVDDARPHNLTVTNKASDLEITLDGVTVASTNGQPPRRMPSRESIFIGGLPDPWTMTNGRWRENFVGCISRLRVNNDEPIDFAKHHINARNVRSCLSSNRSDYWLNNETK